MNPPSLREVCQAATPGPWHPSPFSGRVIMAGETRIGEANVPNARLIARFSPETALAVYEALEEIQSGVGPFKRDQLEFASAVIRANKERATKILALLDGRMEP